MNDVLLQEVFSQYELPIKTNRKLLNLKDKKWTFKLNPLTYIAAGLMYTYQNVISEQISANCNYQISCSEYTKKCIEKYGLIKGTLLGLNQLSQCIPNIQEEHCEHVISEQNKVINVIE